MAMGDMVHDMLIDRPPSPARMEYRSTRRSISGSRAPSPIVASAARSCRETAGAKWTSQMNSWQNTDQFLTVNHFCSSKDTELLLQALTGVNSISFFLAQIFKLLSKHSLSQNSHSSLSALCQHSFRTLSGLYKHSINTISTLSVLYQYSISTLSGLYQDSIRILSGLYWYSFSTLSALYEHSQLSMSSHISPSPS